MKFAPIAIAAAMIAAPAAADTTVYNSTPADGWFFGDGNDYAPANTAVLTTDDGNQMYLRFHQTYVNAPASVGNVYSFGLGTDPLSFDWGIDINNNAQIDALLTLTNLGSGQTISYNPFPGIDNETANGSTQNSFRFNWIPGLFDANLDNTYQVDMTVNDGLASRTLSIQAMFGTGAAAVPEPGTWALLILGFGLLGGAMRRKVAPTVSYA